MIVSVIDKDSAHNVVRIDLTKHEATHLTAMLSHYNSPTTNNLHTNLSAVLKGIKE